MAFSSSLAEELEVIRSAYPEVVIEECAKNKLIAVNLQISDELGNLRKQGSHK